MIRVLTMLAVVAAVTVLLGLGVQTAHAQSNSLTPEQVDRIKSNCTSIKSTLNQLHVSDALLRVNRGQLYELLAAKLMDPFNARLSNNRLDSKATSAVTVSYRNAFDSFRNDYKAYEEKLSTALKIDCVNQPELFYTTIEQARVNRTKVHDDVLKLNRYVDDYRTAVDDFLLNFERVSQ